MSGNPRDYMHIDHMQMKQGGSELFVAGDKRASTYAGSIELCAREGGRVVRQEALNGSVLVRRPLEDVAEATAGKNNLLRS